MAGDLKTVRIEKRFAAAPEALYQAWLDPDKVRRWLAPGVMKVSDLDIEPLQGGKYCLKMRDTSGAEVEVDARVEALEPGSRIELQWQWKGLSGPGRVVIDLARVSDTETRLRLAHGIFETMDETQNHENGWNACLDKLVRVLEE
ncbi:MAG: SRPBCC domain-containing protein [Ketobacteraceae bacterium]|nr:SRPBCC domain-containing protein [Ketobacteraceae bacterium]